MKCSLRWRKRRSEETVDREPSPQSGLLGRRLFHWVMSQDDTTIHREPSPENRLFERRDIAVGIPEAHTLVIQRDRV